jgi:syntaxin-binding protein 5
MPSRIIRALFVVIFTLERDLQVFLVFLSHDFADPSTLIPTLWLGTSLGSVLTVSITLPDADSRNTSPVLVSIMGKHREKERKTIFQSLSVTHRNVWIRFRSRVGGPIFRLKGSILCMSFLDCNGALVPYSYEPWKDEGKRESELDLLRRKKLGKTI